MYTVHAEKFTTQCVKCEIIDSWQVTIYSFINIRILIKITALINLSFMKERDIKITFTKYDYVLTESHT